jgi:hypothetical protein
MDFWKDEGGKKGNNCYLKQLKGSTGNGIWDCGWEIRFYS